AAGGFVGLAAELIKERKVIPTAIRRRDVMAYLSTSIRRNLCASDLSVNFGGVRAVNNLCFDARPGDITSIIGPNGAGKSTVLNLVCGFYRPDSGVVRLGKTDVTRIATHSIAQQGVARTYQTTQLFTHMT